jgi:hypothetical protein
VGFCPLISPVICQQLVPDEREAYRPGCWNPTKTRALSRGFPVENQDISGLAGMIFGHGMIHHTQ